MRELIAIVQDPKNNRFYQLTDSRVAAFGLEPVGEVWSTPWELKLNNPFGIAYHNNHVYIADSNRVLKLAAMTGDVVEEIKLGSSFPQPISAMHITNDKLVLSNTYGAIEVYELESLELIKRLSD